MLEIIRYWVDVIFSLAALIGAISALVIMLSAAIFAIYLCCKEIKQKFNERKEEARDKDE
jgi:hypothetical protein